MAGCGYVCPVCEGAAVDERGNPCGWCQPEVKKLKESDSKTDSAIKILPKNLDGTDTKADG